MPKYFRISKDKDLGKWFEITINCSVAEVIQGKFGEQFRYSIIHNGEEMQWDASKAAHKVLDPYGPTTKLRIRMVQDGKFMAWEVEKVGEASVQAPQPPQPAPSPQDAKVVNDIKQTFAPEPYPSDPGLPFGNEPIADRQDLIMLQNATGHAARLVSALLIKGLVTQDAAILLTQQYAELIFAGYKNHK